MKQKKGAKDTGLELLGVLQDFNEVSAEYVPQLGITCKVMPGKYWFFSPTWFNLKHRWQDVIDSASLIHRTLCWLHTYDSIERLGRSEKFERLSDIGRLEKTYHMENAIVRLYALREKISWIIYDLLFKELALESKTTLSLSYHRLKSTLPHIFDFATLTQDILTQLKDIIDSFDSPEAEKLFEFRHGLTHRKTYGVEIPDPQFLVVKSGQLPILDLMDTARYRYRYPKHLALSVWERFINSTRRFAKLPIPWPDFQLAVEDIQVKKDVEYLVHQGLGIEIPHLGRVRIHCTGNCEYWRGSVEFFEPLGKELLETARLSVTRDILKVARRTVAGQAIGKTKGTVVFLQEPDGSCKSAVLVLKDSLFGQRVDSGLKIGAEIVAEDLVNKMVGKKWVTLAEIIKDIRPDWVKADRVIEEFIERGEVQSHVLREDVGASEYKCWVFTHVDMEFKVGQEAYPCPVLLHEIEGAEASHSFFISKATPEGTKYLLVKKPS